MAATLEAPIAASMEPMRLGRFVLLRRLGQGGLGVVYEAYDPELDRRVALKLLRPGRGEQDTQGRERMLREAHALARLSHPNVVPIHDVGVIEGQVFLVMEYVAGNDLRKWARNKARSWREVLAVYCQAGQGLAAAHAAGLIHRDFKPDNVLIGADGRPRVLDFGLVRTQPSGASLAPEAAARSAKPALPELAATVPVGLAKLADAPVSGMEPTADSSEAGQPPGALPGAGAEQPLTETGAVVGTPAYMALEQFGGGAVGPAADQFSFCVALYEAIYGRRPFAARNILQLFAEIRDGAVLPPPEDSEAPDWLFPLLSRGLRPNPEDRFPSMEALLAELSRDRAGDLSVTRGASVRYIGALTVVTIGAAALQVTGIELAATTPVSPSMVALTLGMLLVYVTGLVIWRRSLMSNAAGRKLMIAIGAVVFLITLQRVVGWYTKVKAADEFVAEFFVMATAGAIGAVMFLRRLVLIPLWACAHTLLIAIWPEHLLLWLWFGFAGVAGVCIWVWFGEWGRSRVRLR